MRLGLAALIVIAACGGKAVIDPVGGGGSGASPEDDDGSPICFTPDPTGETFICDEGGSTGPDGASCFITLCDEDANLWTSECEGDSCQCYFNFDLRCTCTINEPGQTFCGTMPSCCPAPFPE